MKHRLLFSAVAVLAVAAQAAAPRAQAPPAQGSIFTSQTTVVLVPALVRTKSGALVYTLEAGDFLLTDDGVPQKLTLERESGGEPLALVVVVEVGGAGARQFQNYDRIAPPLAPMLASIVGNVRPRVAVVTFDSQPDLLQPFTSDVDEAAAALRSLAPGCSRQHHFNNCTGPHPIHDKPLGDNGAAILDSVAFAVNLLRAEPPGYRRAILLLSETVDRGSQATVEQAVRAITDTNTTIYSIGYSTAKSEASHYAHHQLPMSAGGWQLGENPRPNPPGGCMGKDPNPEPDDPTSRWSQFYDCLAQLVPPLTFAKMAAIATADSLQQNVPATVARLTGGEYFKLGKEKNLERDLAAIGNHIPNRYMLSFHPQAPHPGLHNLRLKLPDYEGLEITARTSYWAEPPAPAPPNQ
ncbi:MAG TPA: VWA domain-containing protein [Terracidiphilus sp.]|nr:VWA domain-containing protein [Terracidiphilus sp.]